MADSKFIRERIAIHESGHAIVSYLMGYRVLEINVFPHKVYGYNGYIIDDSKESPSSNEDANKSICICFAGEIAENIKYGFLETSLSGRGLIDRRKASKLLEKHFVDSKTKQTKLLKEQVRTLLEINWSNVERLAEILTRNESGCVLKENAVLRIIREN